MLKSLLSPGLGSSHNVVRENKSVRLRWTGYVARMEGGSAFKILTGKPIGRSRYRWEDNIEMDLKEICVNTRNSIDLA